jgi:hypothetical protein
MIRNLSLITALVLSAAIANSQTVDLTSVNAGFPPSSTTIAQNSGSLLDAGNRIMIGTFDTSSEASATDYFNTNGTDLNTLLGDFSSISTSISLTSLGDKDATLSGAGTVSFSAGGVNTELPSPLNNQKIFIWVFKTDANDANLGTSFSNVTEHGIFSGVTSDWNFGTMAVPTDAKTLRLGEVSQFFVAEGSALQLALVPEPAHFAALFGFLALGVVLWRRRR